MIRPSPWRQILLLAAALPWFSGCDSRSSASASHDYIRTRVEALVHQWVAGDPPLREDGYVYAVDVGQLLVHAVRVRDRDFYLHLRDWAVGHLLVDDPADNFTRGFVVWRWKPEDPRDATGTTEALRLAEALWHGAAAFDRPEDRKLAMTILEGYARHETVDQGIWLIRNYCNLRTRAYATNSFLVDYSPDFLAEVARADPGGPWKRLADNSTALVRKAVAPSGLLYDLIQPEVKTLVPMLDLSVFSPNDVVQLSNAASVAGQAAESAPEVGIRVLDFTAARWAQLRGYYIGRTGDPATKDYPGLTTYSELAFLAGKLGRDDDRRRALEKVTPIAEAFIDHPFEPRLYLAGQILLAMDPPITKGDK